MQHKILDIRSTAYLKKVVEYMGVQDLRSKSFYSS